MLHIETVSAKSTKQKLFLITNSIIPYFFKKYNFCN